MTLTPWIDATSVSDELVPEVDVPSDLAFGSRGETPYRQDCEELLRRAGLRPTRQRLVLGWLLFAKGCRHLTAEMLHAEAVEANIQISLATVYNTLHQFTDAGLLRQIGVDGSKSFFDTDPSTSHHFFVEEEARLFDIPSPGIALDKLPRPLPGYEIARVDVIVHLRRKQSPAC